jgi:hypothetical protein
MRFANWEGAAFLAMRDFLAHLGAFPRLKNVYTAFVGQLT